MGAHKEKEWTLMDKKPAIKVGDRVACIATMGGFGEYVISPENDLMPVPDHVTDEEASLFEPVCLTTNIVRQTVEQNSTVMVIGAGALGLMCIQLAKIYGAKKVITSEPVAFKRELALKVGADYAIDPKTQNVCHEVEKITNGRFCNAVIECVGLPETIRLIPYVAAQNAKVGCIGACTEPCLFDWSYIHFKGMMVTSQMAGWVLFGNFDDMMMRGMDMIASGKMDLKSLITHRFKLAVDDINRAFDLIKKDEVIKGVFIFDK
jgi:L-iditol 2-dehydrogenase